ncbi:peptidylprolyl isomerase [Aquiluna borgnonia]|nr:peptidylprolyl isomerase [Aquiluna borgnonia]
MQHLELLRKVEGFMGNTDKLANYQAKQNLKNERELVRKKDNRLALLVGAGALALAFLGQLAYFGIGPGSAPAEEVVAEEVVEESESMVPDPALAENRTWNGSLNLNDQPLGLELFGDLAPQASANFISLAQAGYFESLNCHRLTTEGIFVLQCGDPSGDGTGGPGYSFGPIENAPADDIYPAGTLAMARRGGDAASMGSQFFIVYKDSQIPSDAAGGYTVFGRITSNLEAVTAIAAAGTADDGSDGSPLNAVSLSGISVE